MIHSFKRINQKNEARYIWHLLGEVLEDPNIRIRFLEMLRLQPFERRLVLNHWIKAYWMKNTGPEIIQALAYLFDDNLAAKTLKQIKALWTHHLRRLKPAHQP